METRDEQMQGMHAAVMAQRTDQHVGSHTAIVLADAAACSQYSAGSPAHPSPCSIRGEGGTEGRRDGGTEMIAVGVV
jgi:hypothetical protein